MRKRIVRHSVQESLTHRSALVGLDRLAQVEITSEDAEPPESRQRCSLTPGRLAGGKRRGANDAPAV